MTEPPIFDRAAAVARLGGSVALLHEIAKAFVEECPRLMADVRAAVARQDAKSLADAAHALKGTVAYFSAAGPCETLEVLERAARKGDLSSSVVLLGVLEGQVEGLTAAIAAGTS